MFVLLSVTRAGFERLQHLEWVVLSLFHVRYRLGRRRGAKEADGRPWKALAAVEAIKGGDPAYVMIAAPVSTKPVHDKVRARRLQFVCPSVLMDPAGHPRPFGDPQDPSAERLRSIVVAREAA